MKQKLDEEGTKCNVLSKHQKFNERCCMRCCSPFTFLINTKHQCLDCKYNICKNCSTYNKKKKAWICKVCQQAGLLKTQSLEWYYNNVKSRFRRFGSAKVLKNLYKKHLAERGALSDMPEGSICEGSIENEGSICGSDSTFYRQTEGHSMADTLAVALRVAEEAVEEAISKAEVYSDSLEKQNEALYLHDHKEELIEELATTIVQKRSQSAFSLISEDTPNKELDVQSSMSEIFWHQQQQCQRRRKDFWASALPSWKSMDDLDSSEPSSVLQSPDGNWITFQNTAISRPRLLTKPKSQVFKALENESSIVSAYDEMGSKSDDELDWNGTLNELCQRSRKLSDETYYTDSQYDSEWVFRNGRYQSVTSPSSGRYTNTETIFSDSETSSVNSLREATGSNELSLRRRKEQNNHRERKCYTEHMDVNFNPQAGSLESVDSSETEESQYESERRSRRRHKSKVLSGELCEDGKCLNSKKTGSSSCQDFGDLCEADMNNGTLQPSVQVDRMEEKLKSRLFELASRISDKESSSSDEQETDLSSKTQELQESPSCEENDGNFHEELKKKYSAISLCNISTEVLKVINATEEFIVEATGPCEPSSSELPERGKLPVYTDAIKLDEQFTKLEENVYTTAGMVYGLEGQLSDLEGCARSISSVTAGAQLAELEDQVATAAAQVHQAELKISDIEKRISALTVAGLNVTPCGRLSRKRDPQQINQVETIDTSRKQRRKLPATPVQGTVRSEIDVT
ncbi:rab effector MyRIP [Latimeria chalumnae]|uniref:rab effector MyRIP n=1 Tax=Latimeria chalumnae TaxID=7897 RepID=UPI00313C942D